MPLRGSKDEWDGNLISCYSWLEMLIQGWMMTGCSEGLIITLHILYRMKLLRLWLPISCETFLPGFRNHLSSHWWWMKPQMFQILSKQQLSEQTTVILRLVSEDLIVNEKFIGLYQVPSIDVVNYYLLKDTSQKLNLSLLKLRGKCYDGASFMSGAKNLV